MNGLIVIDGFRVRRDVAGRYCLNGFTSSVRVVRNDTNHRTGVHWLKRKS